MRKAILYNSTARLFFIIGSYILHIQLARLLGTHYYGIFGVVLSILMICHIFLNNGIRQAVSRLTASYPESGIQILYTGLKYQLIISITISMILLALNPVITRFFNDPELKLPLYLIAGLVFSESIYFIINGLLNGLYRFLSESIVLSSYSIGRCFVPIFIVYLGFKTGGAVAGLLIANVLSIVIGVFLCHNCGRKNIDLKRKHLLGIAWPTMLTFGFISLIMNIDLLAIKHYLEYNKNIAGFYAAAAAMSKPVYWFLFAFGNVSMPILAQGFIRGENEFVRKTIHNIFSYTFCIVSPGIIILRAIGDQLIEILFKIEYLPAAKPFTILVIGFFFLGLSTIFAHFLIAIKRENNMVPIAIIAAIVCIILNITLVPKYHMIGAAISTTTSSFFMALSLGITVAFSVGSFIKLRSIFKWAVVLWITWLLAKYIKGNLLYLFIYSILLYMAGCLAFIFMKEIELKDLLGSLWKNKL